MCSCSRRHQHLDCFADHLLYMHISTDVFTLRTRLFDVTLQISQKDIVSRYHSVRLTARQDYQQSIITSRDTIMSDSVRQRVKDELPEMSAGAGFTPKAVEQPHPAGPPKYSKTRQYLQMFGFFCYFLFTFLAYVRWDCSSNTY
jgi:hypothetical protein